jgi:nicotinamide-nucleotide amidase
MKVHILNIGDEILIGQILNSNAAVMANYLNEYGLAVEEMKTISDSSTAIKDAVNQALQVADIVLITGGLGPTKDDITKTTLAELFGLKLEYHQPSFDNIVRLFAEFGRIADDRYKTQAFMPVGADILTNKVGTAAGMWFEKEGKIIVSMPGVPREMQYLMQNEVLPRIKSRFQMPAIQHVTLQTMGKGETDLSDMLENLETNQLPAHIKLAYLPDTILGKVRLRLTAKGKDAQILKDELFIHVQTMKSILGNLIFGEGETSIEAEVGKLLTAQKLTLSTAESCTGGNIAKRITSIAGSSGYFLGSVVAYSNPIKENLLKVKHSTLENDGAVSENCVKEMSKGARELLNTDYAIAVSGIAGPDGGRADKPVGTIWLAIADSKNVYSKKLQLGSDRNRNIELTSSTALNLLRLLLLGQEF